MFLDPRCGLVHSRLSILDLSSAGHQPMQADDLPVWITYNGEIYNYCELKEKLATCGWAFASRTDTEVILKGYVQWGVEIFQYLRGMYAVAIWDARDETLVLARDPFGIKPIYYAVLPKRWIVFGSELKAVLAFDMVPKKINRNGVGQFFRYLYIPEPLSIYEGIERLPPGATLVWKRGSIRLGVPVRANFSATRTNQRMPLDCTNDLVEEVTATLRDSVAAHLIADVPVGAFLSGGVDSSLVVGLMRQLTNRELHTFSIVYPEKWKSFDEGNFARSVAKRMETHHHEIVVDSSVVRDLDAMLVAFDEPFGNPAGLMASALSKYTRRYVKVVLSGVGGDEFFGGYPRYLAVGWYSRLKQIPRSLLFLSEKLLSVVRVSPDRKNTIARLQRLMHASLDRTPSNFFDDLSCFATPELVSPLIAPELARTISWRDPLRIPVNSQELSPSWAMAVDASTYLPGDLLTYTDRSSMRYALEVRTPFVDRNVATLAAALPENVKLRGLETKWLLKKIALHFIPREAVYRKKKGFSLPIAYWLRRELKTSLEEMGQPASLREVPELNPRGVQNLLSRHRSGDDAVAYLVWAILVYVLWRQRNKAIQI